MVTAGSFDLLVEVVVEDDDAPARALTNRIRAVPGVRSTETFIYLASEADLRLGCHRDRQPIRLET